MTRFYVKLIVRAIMNFPGSHGYSIIKNLLALPIHRSLNRAGIPATKGPHGLLRVDDKHPDGFKLIP